MRGGNHPNTRAAHRRRNLRTLAAAVEAYVEAWGTINRLRRALAELGDEHPTGRRLERELARARAEASSIKKKIYGTERNFEAAGGTPEELLCALWRS